MTREENTSSQHCTLTTSSSSYPMTLVPSMLPSLSPMYPMPLFLLFHCLTSPLTVLPVSGSELLAVVLADNSAPESVTEGLWFQRATRPATRSDMGLARRLKAVTSWVFLRSTSSCCRFWDSSARIWYWWTGGRETAESHVCYLVNMFCVLENFFCCTTGLQSVSKRILRTMKPFITGLCTRPMVWRCKRVHDVNTTNNILIFKT